MCNSERKPKASVSAIWTDAVLEGEPARVSIVNGVARIRIDWFDIHVPGKFDSDVNDVIAAYKRQQMEIDKAISNLPADSKQPSCCDDLIPISDEELDEQIREYDKHRGQVINIKTRQ